MRRKKHPLCACVVFAWMSLQICHAFKKKVANQMWALQPLSVPTPHHLFKKECFCSFSLLLFSFTELTFSQHRRGKQGRLITFDNHKWNVNGLWNHIKVPDGCEWCQKPSAWFACHSVTFGLFSVPILMEIDVYTGWQGGLEEWKEGRKEHSNPWGGKGENGRQWMKTDW